MWVKNDFNLKDSKWYKLSNNFSLIFVICAIYLTKYFGFLLTVKCDKSQKLYKVSKFSFNFSKKN